MVCLERHFDNTERMENLSYAVKYYRKKKGYTQESLSEELGIAWSVSGFAVQHSHSSGNRALSLVKIPFRPVIKDKNSVGKEE